MERLQAALREIAEALADTNNSDEDCLDQIAEILDACQELWEEE